jgi:hypothetical protein
MAIKAKMANMAKAARMNDDNQKSHDKSQKSHVSVQVVPFPENGKKGQIEVKSKG